MGIVRPKMGVWMPDFEHHCQMQFEKDTLMGAFQEIYGNSDAGYKDQCDPASGATNA